MYIFCTDVYISVYMWLGKSKWRWHTEKILKCQVRIEKKQFQDDYMFEMRRLKGLKLSQIILNVEIDHSLLHTDCVIRFNWQHMGENKTILNFAWIRVFVDGPIAHGTKLIEKIDFQGL